MSNDNVNIEAENSVVSASFAKAAGNTFRAHGKQGVKVVAAAAILIAELDWTPTAVRNKMKLDGIPKGSTSTYTAIADKLAERVREYVRGINGEPSNGELLDMVCRDVVETAKEASREGGGGTWESFRAYVLDGTIAPSAEAEAEAKAEAKAARKAMTSEAKAEAKAAADAVDYETAIARWLEKSRHNAAYCQHHDLGQVIVELAEIYALRAGAAKAESLLTGIGEAMAAGLAKAQEASMADETAAA